MSLNDDLLRQIALNGPMSVAEFMAQALLHPTKGYYSTRDPFGEAGDFITAPEITQMFGEMIGLCLASTWMEQGKPQHFALVELGPGRGTLMKDILRTTRAVKGFNDAADVHLVEASATLRDLQRKTLGDDIQHHETADDLPDLPIYAVANEFFDALAIRQFVRDDHGWRERQVGAKYGQLIWGLSAAAPVAQLDHRLADTQNGDVVEICPAAATAAHALGDRIERNGGAALIIDYGDWRSQGDTLQAVKAHKYVDPLDSVGNADLTAHVDFEAIANECPCAHSRLTAQGVFLERLGITARAQALAKLLEPVDLETHISAHRRLTHPEEMGTLFKVMGLFPKGAQPPVGLEI